MTSKRPDKKDDQFSKIASLRIDMEGRNLIYHQPPGQDLAPLPLTSSDSASFEPAVKMTTPEQLREELEHQRERHAPFFVNLAPSLEECRESAKLTEFDWRVGTDKDPDDLNKALAGQGDWERLTVPHYGAPLGKAVTYYRRNIQVDEGFDRGDRVLYLRFKGVDYRTAVFINGQFAGSHEGFFAPFELNISSLVKPGKNVLLVKVENDFILGSNSEEGFKGIRKGGDKIYAATGPGYDDPQTGWHHCPPGMGIYQDVILEYRNPVFAGDLFVRPLPDEQKAEAWIEVENTLPDQQDIVLELSLYGQNFKETLFERMRYEPSTAREIGVGDSCNEINLRAAGLIDKPVKLYMERGRNYLKIPFALEDFRTWEPDTPWLYQLQVRLMDKEDRLLDASKVQFGMRTFTQDVESTPKGMFYLNGRPTRLRGANTMGHEQQCVMKGDWDQLRDDLLLAKIAHMNFLRLTQRPVQPEIYDFCDKIGLMIQTDLPLFGVLRRNQYCEALRQTEEMERLIRSHPSCILASYINEPFPNAANAPHRHLNRKELQNFFDSADMIVKMQNPDRVTKHVDGDYDPPSETLPDNHCYNIWYNGNGVDIGKMNKGHWLPVKKDWYWGCGEFGAEGLDPVDLMRRRYPPQWLPETDDNESDWTPSHIIGAQTGRFHYCYFEAPKTLNRWVEKSREYQGQAVRFVTEAFRRQNMLVTQAIHLFIDAFPSGWMKTIMDCERRPKPAYFAYREALTPLSVQIRTDRYTWFSGEELTVEAWLCNDTMETPAGILRYDVLVNGRVRASGEMPAQARANDAFCRGTIRFDLPEVSARTPVTVRLALFDGKEALRHDTERTMTVFPPREAAPGKGSVPVVYIPDGPEGKARTLAAEMDLPLTDSAEKADVILIDRFDSYLENKELLDDCVAQGTRLVFLSLPPGTYPIGPDANRDNLVHVKFSSMLPLHFVSRDTGHPLVIPFEEDDFRYWYDTKKKAISPLIDDTFTAPGFTPILGSGNTDDSGEWVDVLACGEKKHGRGSYILCQVDLTGRTEHNPVATHFADRLLRGAE